MLILTNLIKVVVVTNGGLKSEIPTLLYNILTCHERAHVFETYRRYNYQLELNLFLVSTHCYSNHTMIIVFLTGKIKFENMHIFA